MSAKVSIIDGKPFVQLDGETLTPTDAVLELQALHTEATDDLRRAAAALEETEREHAAALVDGDESDRSVLVAAQADVERARASVKVVEADLSSVQEAIIAHETTMTISAAAQEIEQDTGIHPDLTEAYASHAADLGLQLAVAEAEHRKALAEVDVVRDRVDGIDQRIGEITKKRLEGDATAGNAAELAALDYDVRALQKIMGEAKQKTSRLDPHELRSQHQRTVADWNSHIRDARLKALASVVQSREKELVDALSRLVDSAHSAGIQSLTDVWRPSASLEAFTSRTLLSALTRRAA